MKEAVLRHPLGSPTHKPLHAKLEAAEAKVPATDSSMCMSSSLQLASLIAKEDRVTSKLRAVNERKKLATF